MVRPVVLHGGALDGRLHVWAETTAVRARATRAVVASRRALREGIGRVVPGLPDDGAEDVGAVAWLPTVAGALRPSSGLLDVDASPELGEIAAHNVATLVFEGAALVTFCAALREPLLAPYVFRGADLAFWAETFAVAVRFVAAGRYLPSFDGTRATWLAFPRAADRRDLAERAQAMPAACRALSVSRTTRPNTMPAAELEAFLHTAVDAMVRGAAGTCKPMRAPHGVHDRWIAALAAPDATVRGTGAELTALRDSVAAWCSERRRDEDAEFRLTLRLEEPAADSHWHVAYLLQSQRDASLLVAAADAWRTARFRRGMLDALGRAARASPAIAASLGGSDPLGYDLDDAGAHRFLTEELGALEAAGIAVLLPAWWTLRGAPLRLSARASVRAPKGMGGEFRLDSIVDVNWQIALGDDVLGERELSELARLKTPLVRVRGKWVVIEAADVAAALALREKRSEQHRLSEVLGWELGTRRAVVPFAVDGVIAQGGLASFFERLRGRDAIELEPPPNLHATLRPYQRRGYSWLASLAQIGVGAALADDMGLGKSLQTLALIARDRAAGESRAVLIVAPTSVIGNWQREIERFAPSLPVLVHHGAGRDRDAPFGDAGVAVVLTSYQLLVRDLAAFTRARWHGLVLDEAQFVKNPESQAARAVRAIASSYRIALTGTPVENHPGDLWALLDFLNPGLLGTASAFRKGFVLPIAAGSDDSAADRLRAATSPFLLRRLKSDPGVIADLPKKFETRVFCTLTQEQASLYAAILRDVDEALTESEGMERKALVLATLTKLKQVCNHPANLLHDGSPLAGRSGKLARLGEMLDEVHANGEHALVFTQYTEMAAMIRTYLQNTTGREAFYLHGGVSKAERDRMVVAFQERADAPTAFVISLRAGGTGLNLTRANHVFHFDRWWNPAVENQASDRAHRIGQRKDVRVWKFVCAGTVEERIDALLERKSKLATRLVQSGEGGITELSDDDLREFLSLAPVATGDA